MTKDPRIRKTLSRPPRPEQALTRAAIAVSFARWHRESRLLLAHLKSLPIDERVLWLIDPTLKPSVEAMVPEHAAEFNRSIPADAAKSALKRGIKKGRRDGDAEAAVAMLKTVAAGAAIPFKMAWQGGALLCRGIGSAARWGRAKMPLISVSGVGQVLGNGAAKLVAATWWMSALPIAAGFAWALRGRGEVLVSLAPVLTVLVLMFFNGRPRWGRMLAGGIVGLTAGIDLWERGAREIGRLAELWSLMPNYRPLPWWPGFRVYVVPLLQAADCTALVGITLSLSALAMVSIYIGKNDD